MEKFEQYACDNGGLLREAKNANSHLKITRDKPGSVVEEWQDGCRYYLSGSQAVPRASSGSTSNAIRQYLRN
jgi:hypothetical protein